jgi:hypothetical protein
VNRQDSASMAPPAVSKVAIAQWLLSFACMASSSQGDLIGRGGARGLEASALLHLIGQDAAWWEHELPRSHMPLTS